MTFFDDDNYFAQKNLFQGQVDIMDSSSNNLPETLLQIYVMLR